MGKELFPPLFREHGTAYMIDMGPLGGWNLALNQATDIYDCLSRSDDFEVCVPGAQSCGDEYFPVSMFCFGVDRLVFPDLQVPPRHR